MNRVVVLKIEEYTSKALQKKIGDALMQYFSLKELFPPKDQVLLKPNLLMESLPEEAIVTHPLFIEAVGRIFKKLGCSVCIADSPGGFISKKDVDGVYQGTGVKEVADRNGFELLYPTHSIVHKNLPLCWWTHASALPQGPGEFYKSPFKMVNLPKLKTHDIMVLTLAVKNLYGCISGIYKSHIHRQHPTTDDLAKVILGLYKNIKPSLNIVDGILSLEGEGPAKKGRPRKLNIVVIGDDALSTDYVIGRFLGLSDAMHPLIKRANAGRHLERRRSGGNF
ncbi:MAG: DUF362 domain-containing protein [Candidatus Omnitrophota bacterium]|nr:MAG: DUF362 domain-containing protein [Candidatus Omnitrophota bacterium]